jgi:muramoyltetrapeptide carboxypeptidase
MTTPLIRPKPLPRDGHVIVLAISSASERQRIEVAARNLERYGLRVTLAPNIDARFHDYLAGDDATRLAPFNAALRSDAYDAFFFARGGYGAMRLLDGVDYDAIRRNPRPIVGFSDLTALHQAVAVRAGVATFHGPMLNLDFHPGLSPEIEQWFWRLLGGESPNVHSFQPQQVVSTGVGEGILFGGCLSLTHALLGTPYDYWVDDGIWFWEEVGEATYRLDRMLTTLRLSGRLKKIRGVVIGKLKDCGPDPREVDWLLSDFFASSGVPVVRDLPFGHFGDNLLMPFGAPARLDTSAGTLTFPDPVVEPNA